MNRARRGPPSCRWGACATYDPITASLHLSPEGQALSGGSESDRSDLATWVEDTGLPDLRAQLAAAPLDPNSAEVAVIERGDFVLRATPARSRRWLFIAAWKRGALQDRSATASIASRARHEHDAHQSIATVRHRPEDSMKIHLHVPGERARRCHVPSESADHVIATGACPSCGAKAFRVRGLGKRVADRDTYVADAVAVCCGKPIGPLRVTVSTIFGIEEDERVLNGPWKVY